MEMTENELQNSEIGYPIYLPKSEHAVERAAFSDRFWQQRPPKAKNPKATYQEHLINTILHALEF